jgi:2-dehydro-3-deoxyphosphogluconate aldolase / (4S)-4-hydroxy-2-oxoglutarate aldolase
MAPHLPGKLGVAKTLLFHGIVPNFHTDDPATARTVAIACVEGGCPILEYTNRGDGALTVFEGLAAWARREQPTLTLGAGTITESATAAAYINAGAKFIVGPTFNGDTSRLCNRRGVLYIPGCATPTEIGDALESGAMIVKLFPATPGGGPPLLRAVLAPLPHALVMPSGGIGTDDRSLRGWFAAGAACVSIGSNLFPPTVGTSSSSAAAQAVRAVVDSITAIRVDLGV